MKTDLGIDEVGQQAVFSLFAHCFTKVMKTLCQEA